MNIMYHLVNTALKTGKLLDVYKVGYVTPVLKKTKNPTNPSNYRRITITSIIGKVVEKVLIDKVRPILDPLQSHLQFGFTQSISPVYAALIISLKRINS